MASDIYSPDLRTREYTGKLKRAYVAWNHMQARCYNPRNPDFHNYGGRGICVCPKWYKFEGFLEDMGYPPEGLSLDRKDSNGNYEKDNCRWADTLTQGRNKRSTKLTREIVAQIKADVRGGLSHRKAGAKYGINHGNVSLIMHGINWSDVA